MDITGRGRMVPYKNQYARCKVVICWLLSVQKLLHRNNPRVDMKTVCKKRPAPYYLTLVILGNPSK